MTRDFLYNYIGNYSVGWGKVLAGAGQRPALVDSGIGGVRVPRGAGYRVSALPNRLRHLGLMKTASLRLR
jgi:hypothetical protein